VAEWSKALAWKVSMGQKPIEGSNPSVSANKKAPLVGAFLLMVIEKMTTLRYAAANPSAFTKTAIPSCALRFV
jgi:hypothetical protein